MLVGEPGVGKTAVVEGLARLIEMEPEKVPARLRGSHVVQLQMGGIVAGTMLRGMFEETNQRHHRRGQGTRQSDPLHR